MNSNNDNELLNTYRYYNFQEPNDDQESANLKRICLTQYLITFNNLGCTTTTSDILDKKLAEYSDIVDDHDGLNNYAKTLEVYTSNLRDMNILHWKNELKLSNIKWLVDSVKCCSNNDITKKDLETFLSVNKKYSQPKDKNEVLLQHKSTFSTKPTQNNFTPATNFPYKDNSEQFPKTAPKNNAYGNFKAPRNELKEQNFQRYGLRAPDSRQGGASDQFNRSAPKENSVGSFKTARDELEDQNLQRYGSRPTDNKQNMQVEGRRKTLGTRRGIHSKFVPPTKNYEDEDGAVQCRKDSDTDWKSDGVIDEKLKNIEPRMVELIKSEIMNSSANITWDDIAGLGFAKMVIKEVVVLPMLRPDIFTGLRRPPKGILLFGPPGTGKTLIGKCIASQSNSTFFSISASSLTSKWIGDGEKMVRAMFAVARTYQPAVIFIDEIDSLLSQRSETEHESTRRLKTEFLIQLDGAATESEDRILVIGATNRPKELDEAARRRFVKRLYIPLPEKLARLEIVKNLMRNERHELTEEDIAKIAELADGYSGADMMNLCSEASLGPIRAIDINQIQNIEATEVRPITMKDFQVALERVRASVSPDDLNHYVEWNQTFGTGNYH